MPLTGAVGGSPSLEIVRVNHSNIRVKQLKGTLRGCPLSICVDYMTVNYMTAEGTLRNAQR